MYSGPKSPRRAPPPTAPLCRRVYPEFGRGLATIGILSFFALLALVIGLGYITGKCP